MIDEKTQHFGLPLPHDLNDLSQDNPRLREALRIIDSELQRMQEANDLLSGGGAGFFARLLAAEATVAHLTRRVTELELALVGMTSADGVYRGPVAVGSSMAAMGHCGMLVLTAPVVEPVGNPSETPPNSHDGDQGENQ